MRKFLAGALTLAFALGVVLPQIAQAQSMQQRLQQKLQQAWLKRAPWITDYDKARAEAKKQGKAIFVYFSRSYSP